jgi:transcriptional regulator with XRE-family HTH domain
MPRGGPSYPVRELFRLLKFMGVSQQDVVARLGVSKGHVSQWANGRRLMPERYVSMLIKMAQEAHTTLLTQLDAAWRGGPLSDAVEQVLNKLETVMALWAEWTKEQSASILIPHLADVCRELAPYSYDPSKLEAVVFGPEVVQIRNAFEFGLRILKRIEQGFDFSADNLWLIRTTRERIEAARSTIAQLRSWQVRDEPGVTPEGEQ